MTMNKGLGAAIFIVSLFWTLAATAAPRLIAHGGDEQLWLAQVVSGTSASPSQAVTQLRWRQINKPWRAPLAIEGTVTALASRDDDLIVLFDNGAWRRFWNDNGSITSAIGLPLPTGGRILDVASDSRSLWGIVMPAQPATTRAATRPTSDPTTRASGPASPLELFSLTFSQWVWTDRGAVPSALPLRADQPFSLAVVDHRAVIAMVGIDRLVHVAQYTVADPPTTASSRPATREAAAAAGRGGWRMLPPVRPSIVPTQFKLLGDADRPGSIFLWVADKQSAGELYEFKHDRWTGPVILKSGGGPTTGQTLALAGGRFRLFRERGEPASLYVQQFELSGQPVGSETAMQGSADQFGQVEFYLEAILMAVLVIAVIGTFYRRRQSPKPLPAEQLPLAPLGVRFGAGLLDAIPILASIAVAAWRLDGQSSFNAINLDPQFRWILLAGLFVYLFYTTVAEVLTARTIGKMIFGLRVVAVEGKPADWSALLMRNILRVVDIWLAWVPLILVFYTPLRQRIGDVAAATVVVTNAPIRQAQESDPSRGDGQESAQAGKDVRASK